MPSTPLARWAIVSLVVGLAACSGSHDRTSSAADAAEAGTSASQGMGQRAYVDPESGDLTTPAETKAKGPGAAPSAPAKGQPAFAREKRPDGSVMMRPKAPARHVIEGHVDGAGVLHTQERDQHAD